MTFAISLATALLLRPIDEASRFSKQPRPERALAFRLRGSQPQHAERRFPREDQLLTENRRGALGGAYFDAGMTGKAEELFRSWLDADPGWGWAWAA